MTRRLERELGSLESIPFYSTKFAGRGLGLASALGVVRRHGGWIGAGNDPSGRGARFQVLFPSERLD